MPYVVCNLAARIQAPFPVDCVSWIQSGVDGPGLPFWRNREAISNPRLTFFSSYSYQLLRRESDCLTAITGCECCPKNVCLQQVEWNHQTRFLFSVENWIEREGSAWSLKLKCVICQCYNTFSYPSLIRRVDNASCSLYCKYCGSAMLSKYCSVYSSLTTMPRQKHY